MYVALTYIILFGVPFGAARILLTGARRLPLHDHDLLAFCGYRDALRPPRGPPSGRPPRSARSVLGLSMAFRRRNLHRVRRHGRVSLERAAAAVSPQPGLLPVPRQLEPSPGGAEKVQRGSRSSQGGWVLTPVQEELHLPEAGGRCQRWRDRRPTWRRTSEGGFAPGLHRVIEIPEAPARRFVERHHYSGTWPVIFMMIFPSVTSATYALSWLNHRYPRGVRHHRHVCHVVPRGAGNADSRQDRLGDRRR